MLYNKFYETVEALIYIALNSGARAVSSKEINSYLGITPRHLEPVMQSLVQKKILRGTKGPKGGYTLAREKRKICLWEIYQALSSLERNRKAKYSTQIGKKIITKMESDITSSIEACIKEINFEQLCNEASEVSDIKKKSEFSI